MRGAGAWDQNDPVDVQFLGGIAADNQVSVVNRIKRTAEKENACQTQCLRTE